MLAPKTDFITDRGRCSLTRHECATRTAGASPSRASADAPGMVKLVRHTMYLSGVLGKRLGVSNDYRLKCGCDASLGRSD
jgi:hypothetical protein